MLVETYRKEFCLPPNPKAQHLRCYAYLDHDITEVLPYLNSVLGGYQFYRDPPSLTLKMKGRLITLYSKMIAINIVKDAAEADSILEWLKHEINGTWKRRGEIKPSLERAPKPRILDILRLLPKTNCRECGQPTCMVFAAQLSDGSKALDDCRLLDVRTIGTSVTYCHSYFLLLSFLYGLTSTHRAACRVHHSLIRGLKRNAIFRDDRDREMNVALKLRRRSR